MNGLFKKFKPSKIMGAFAAELSPSEFVYLAENFNLPFLSSYYNDVDSLKESKQYKEAIENKKNDKTFAAFLLESQELLNHIKEA